METYTKTKKGKTFTRTVLQVPVKREDVEIVIPEKTGKWLLELFPLLSVDNEKTFTYGELQKAFEQLEQDEFSDFDDFWQDEAVLQLRDHGLLVL